MAPRFPTIDRAVADAGNVATEIDTIKSIDVTAKSYQVPGALHALILGYATKLAQFRYATSLKQTVIATETTKRSLHIALEPGAGSAEQLAEIERATVDARAQGVAVALYYIR